MARNGLTLSKCTQEAEARMRRSVGSVRESGTGESTLALSGHSLVRFGKEAEMTAIPVNATGQAGALLSEPSLIN